MDLPNGADSFITRVSLNLAAVFTTHIINEPGNKAINVSRASQRMAAKNYLKTTMNQ